VAVDRQVVVAKIVISAVVYLASRSKRAVETARSAGTAERVVAVARCGIAREIAGNTQAVAGTDREEMKSAKSTHHVSGVETGRLPADTAVAGSGSSDTPAADSRSLKSRHTGRSRGQGSKACFIFLLYTSVMSQTPSRFPIFPTRSLVR
jgi:hypothetical protein